MNSKKLLFLFLIIFVFKGSFAQKKFQQANDDYAVKKNNFMFSLGYGAPSFVRTYLKYKNTHENYEVSGFGPFVVKSEFMLSKKFGVGINASFSQSKINWLEEGGYDTIQQVYRAFEQGIKAYEVSNPKRKLSFLEKKTN